jgi:cytoplasmic iron level regulating protein YaaA (DUF328/UPF0246 family)
MINSIALIGCVKQKSPVPNKARFLYTSELFKKTVEYVEYKKYSNWYVLSAFYGLVDKDEVIKPYDLTLTTFSKEKLEWWAIGVFQRLMERNINNISFFCGKTYYQELLPLLDENKIAYSTPLGNLSFGQRLAFLSRRKGFFYE